MRKYCVLCGRERPLARFRDRRTGAAYERCDRHRVDRSYGERVAYRLHNLNWRARSYGVTVMTLTLDEVRLKYKKARNVCPTCKKRLPSKYDLELSHVIPLCEGGANSDGNVILECHACNRAREIERRKNKAAA